MNMPTILPGPTARSKPGELKPPSAAAIRKVIKQSLRAQGFNLDNDTLRIANAENKEVIRQLHCIAVKHKLERSQPALARHESRLLGRFARGIHLDPESIRPQLVEVLPGSEDELLFRYASLRWSIPVSSGYGRRLRYLVVDTTNNKLIGLIGLGDPVYSLGCRDQWIGWSKDQQRQRLRHVMDAFVLGAVEPYASLLCGKLVAMLVSSSEVQQSFARKYGTTRSLITGCVGDARLALITTLSALGRSSIYNRLRIDDRLLFQPMGYSKGSGEFHFTNGTYQLINSYAIANCTWSAKHEAWGTGARNRREVVRKCLQHIGLPDTLMYHGIRRQAYAIPLASNTRAFLCGQASALDSFNVCAEDLYESFKKRWMIPRASRDTTYRDKDPTTQPLWNV